MGPFQTFRSFFDTGDRSAGNNEQHRPFVNKLFKLFLRLLPAMTGRVQEVLLGRTPSFMADF